MADTPGPNARVPIQFPIVAQTQTKHKLLENNGWEHSSSHSKHSQLVIVVLNNTHSHTCVPD